VFTYYSHSSHNLTYKENGRKQNNVFQFSVKIKWNKNDSVPDGKDKFNQKTPKEYDLNPELKQWMSMKKITLEVMVSYYSCQIPMSF
jgi:hypothetical protein